MLANNIFSIKLNCENKNLLKIKHFKKPETLEFDFEKILYIEKHVSITNYENRFRWFFWDDFFYYIIVLKSGIEIFVPCILCDNLEEVLSKDFKKIKRFYPIYMYRYKRVNNS